MSAPKKSPMVALALIGTLMGSAALADKTGMGMGMGMGDMGMGMGEGRGAMLGQMFDTLDADKDGKLTLAEIQAQRTAEFAAADSNGDGALSAEELSALQLARFQERLAERTQMMLDNLDNDGNGSLSADELGQSMVERRFARIDTDNDGAISKEEAEGAMQHRKKRGHGWGMSDD